jgi:hypothetical protein
MRSSGEKALMRAPFLAKAAALLCLSVSMCAVAGAAESEDVRENLSRILLLMDGPRDRNCAERKVVKTETIEARVERWTLDRCGKLVNYRVRFSTNAKGGTDFDVQLEK